jgi:uncharacterized damage-inducible protein DinB
MSSAVIEEAKDFLDSTRLLERINQGDFDWLNDDAFIQQVLHDNRDLPLNRIQPEVAMSTSQQPAASTTANPFSPVDSQNLSQGSAVKNKSTTSSLNELISNNQQQGTHHRSQLADVMREIQDSSLYANNPPNPPTQASQKAVEQQQQRPPQPPLSHSYQPASASTSAGVNPHISLNDLILNEFDQ